MSSESENTAASEAVADLLAKYAGEHDRALRSLLRLAWIEGVSEGVSRCESALSSARTAARSRAGSSISATAATSEEKVSS